MPVPQLKETEDVQGAFSRLSRGQVEALASQGERRPTEEGEVLIREGEPTDEFFVVLEGLVAVVHLYGDPRERTIGVHGVRRFLGELTLLTGQPSFYTGVVRAPGAVLAVPVDRLRALVQRDAALGDLILRAFLLRRNLLMNVGAGLRIVGSRYSAETRRLREFAARNRLPHQWIDPEEDPEAEALLRELGITPAETPVVLLDSRQVLRNPSNADLARLLGMPAPAMHDDVCDLVVIGAGPGGLAASLYGASEGLDTVTLEAFATGGQAETSSRIENYLGFPAGLSGAELADRALLQAQKFGASLHIPAEVCGLERVDGHYAIELADGGSVGTRTVVIATGVRYRKLPVPNLEDFEGSSIYYAATLMEAQLCHGDPVVVVGGGNSAGQGALFLSEHAASVTLAVREHELEENMSRYLADRIERSSIEVLVHTEVRELVGDGVLEAIVVEDTDTGDRRRLPAKALFVFIGAEPHTEWLEGRVALDDGGYILTGNDAITADRGPGLPAPQMLETSLPGVFAAGDVRSGSVQRVASAVGEGSMAVRLVHAHLADGHHPRHTAHRAVVTQT